MHSTADRIETIKKALSYFDFVTAHADELGQSSEDIEKIQQSRAKAAEQLKSLTQENGTPKM